MPTPTAFRLLGDNGEDKKAGGDSDAESDALNELLDDWVLPENNIELPVDLTFMFTDIIDSKALTEQIGTMPMRLLLRTHNRIIRRAIERQNGTEVKHTGDGFLATFTRAQNAVEAATQMQQEIDLHSREKPDSAFEIRIGIHEGEAVKERHDYFGTAVKTTARICAEADSEEIWISEDIRASFPDDDDRISHGGEMTLEGQEDPITLFIADWERVPERFDGEVEYTEIGTVAPR